MRAIEAKHLVVGGGLLGLSTADHLLRRGADGVVVVEKGSTPGQSRRGASGLVLSTGNPENGILENRSHLLLDDWPTYLEVDPHFRRAGSLVFPGPDRLPADWESIESDDPRLRSVSSEHPPAFAGRDGIVNSDDLASALHWRVRRQGGRVITDCAILRLEQRRDRIGFSSSSREGLAERVYLTAGAESPALARTLGITLPFRHARWQEMQLVGEPSDFKILRLRRFPPHDFPGGEVLELESSTEPQAAVHEDTEVIVIQEDGTIQLSLVRPCGPRSDDETVDWSLWESVREELTAIVPGLGSARVRSGRAETVLSLDANPIAPVLECEGRLLAAGGFGLSGLLLALSLGETLAEAGLGQG